jgi:hypothetical protein
MKEIKADLINVDLDLLIKKMADNWFSELIPRTKVGEFTGGLISSKTMANLDSLGQGPPRISCGRKTGYPKSSFCTWLKSRCVVRCSKEG